MRVKVKLYASLQNGRFEEQALEVPEGTQVRRIAADLGIPGGQVGILLVNGRHGRLDDVLQPEDSVALFPPVGGG
jgi:molybdopterin converting factor small subunit